jgi:hypothetical protein
MSDGLRAIRDLGVGDWSLDAVDAAVKGPRINNCGAGHGE